MMHMIAMEKRQTLYRNLFVVAVIVLIGVTTYVAFFDRNPGYTFTTDHKIDGELGGFTDFQVNIYKDGALLKTIPIRDVNGDVSSYTLSPDEKYVAFKASANEGGCQFTETLLVFDLGSLAFVTPKQSRADPESTQTPRTIENIRWVDGKTLETTVGYGVKYDSGACGPYTAKTKTYTLQ